ncbi:MAG: 5-(carboxyamino)imidazole ribonucleotide synthase [Pseudomonadota bacterium]
MHVGVIGGGQLGRMLALAGIPLGMRFSFLDPGDAPCAGALGDVVNAAFDNAEAIEAFAARCDALTFEFENIPAQLLSGSDSITILPPANALFAAQERAREKSLFEACDIPVAPWRAVDSQSEVDAVVEELGLPLIAKTRSLGYDGKGQSRILAAEDARGLFERLGNVPLLVERLVPFDQEVSVIGTRGADGQVIIYPLTRNVHRDGILHTSETIGDEKHLARQAVHHFRALAEATDYVGTLAIEFFVKDGLLLGNEFAPRVHNSGHWTQNGAPYSQFENHLRAITGLPLGTTALSRPSGMLNLVGSMPTAQSIEGDGLFFHAYDKSPRPGRKIGHINIVADTQESVRHKLVALSEQLNLGA